MNDLCKMHEVYSRGRDITEWQCSSCECSWYTEESAYILGILRDSLSWSLVLTDTTKKCQECGKEIEDFIFKD